MIIAIGIVYTPIFARVVRGPVLALKEREFVEAARALALRAAAYDAARDAQPDVGAGRPDQHRAVVGGADRGVAVVSGPIAQPPAPSWGVMLNEGRQNLELAPHLAIFPGLAIMLAVLGFNLLGDGLRDALDPRLHR